MKQNSGNIKRAITKNVMETIENEQKLGEKLMEAVLAITHIEIDRVMKGGIENGSIVIDWQGLAEELGIENPSDRAKMLIILENETVNKMAESCYLSQALFTDKSKHRLSEENLNPKKWIYLAD
jgi:hypothetical protein